MRPPIGIRVGAAGKKGRGVFATREFLPGDVIERSPIIIIDDLDDVERISATRLENYWYSAGGDACAIGLGFASLYNHSYKANANYDVRPDDDLVEIVAVRKIRPDTEITINYNGDPNCKTKIKLFAKRSSADEEEPDQDLKLVHYVAQGDWEDVWTWCGTYGVPWTAVPGLVTCKKCKSHMIREKHRLLEWHPDRDDALPQHELLSLMEDVAEDLFEKRSIYSNVIYEAIRRIGGG
ncbi:MAG: SET domain-containing protein-lysine N-methyltransferase [Nitrospira sp.]